jgi:hypothetical protein
VLWLQTCTNLKLFIFFLFEPHGYCISPKKK